MINYAVSSFPKQSLDEWILDYPQQVILTTIHLILSHEINELLEEKSNMNEDDTPADEDDNADESDTGSNLSPSRQKAQRTLKNNVSSMGHKSFSKQSSKGNVQDDEEDLVMKEYLRKKNEF